MARIRSIKPEFFTSEKIAALPLSTRLTFIGLWTHVDDNGVTIDNPKLITAAIWPLEDDPSETLARTLEDLRRLAEAGLIERYEHADRQLLFITGWDEHQRVSHPGKTRYQRPSKPATSGNAHPPETSGESPETFRPEQGAGSREQGTKTCPPAAPERESDPPRRAKPVAVDSDDFLVFWSAYPRRVGKPRARKAWQAALKRGADPATIIAAAGSYALDQRRVAKDIQYTPHPATWLNDERYNDQPTPAVRIMGPGGAWWNN